MREITMTELMNVTLTKAANIYFDGNVTSRKVTLADGSTKTLGIMMPGEYTFATAEKELMEIMTGDVEILLPNEKNWQSISGGEQFYVDANATFDIKVKSITDYCCSYISS
jgi:purine/pyrimidine-nucleoside phosphorylase